MPVRDAVVVIMGMHSTLAANRTSAQQEAVQSADIPVRREQAARIGNYHRSGMNHAHAHDRAAGLRGTTQGTHLRLPSRCARARL